MVILMQDTVYKPSGKSWKPIHLILTHELDGPSILLYKDASAKKLVEPPLLVSQLGEHMRFGTTATMYGSMPDPRKDPRVHTSCFIAIRSEKLVKKLKQPHMIWICAESTHQLFEIVKILSVCLSSIGTPAPNPSPVDEIHALHRYNPEAFRPENHWEGFWDNPPRPTLEIGPIKQIKTAVSMDAINATSTLDKKAQKKLKKQKYNSTSALDASPATFRSAPALDTSSMSSMESSCYSVDQHPAHPTVVREMLVGEPVPVKQPPKPQPVVRLYELRRTPEMCEVPMRFKQRKYEKYPESAKSTPASRHRHRISSDMNGDSERRSINSEIVAITAPAPPEHRTPIYETPPDTRKDSAFVVYRPAPPPTSTTYGSPHSILKRNSHVYSLPPDDNISQHSYSSVTSERSSASRRNRNKPPSLQEMPLLRRDSAEIAQRRLSLAMLQHQPRLELDSPKPRVDSPKYSNGSMKLGFESPKLRTESPKLCTCTESPKLRIESPKVYTGSPKFHRESPIARVDSPRIHTHSPKIYIESPKIRRESAQLRESPRGRFTNTAVQTDHASEDVPLIHSQPLPNALREGSVRDEEFHSSVRRLREVSQSSQSPATPRPICLYEESLHVHTHQKCMADHSDHEYRSLSCSSDSEVENTPLRNEPKLIHSNDAVRMYTMEVETAHL